MAYEYTVKVDGQVIAKRKSARIYSHALVAEQHAEPSFSYVNDRHTRTMAPLAEPRLVINGFARTEELARKALRTWTNRSYFGEFYRNPRLVALDVREIQPRQPKLAQHPVTCNRQDPHMPSTASCAAHPAARSGNGCGRSTHVIGTNGGTMPCGAMLKELDGTARPYLCGQCQALTTQPGSAIVRP